MKVGDIIVAARKAVQRPYLVEVEVIRVSEKGVVTGRVLRSTSSIDRPGTEIRCQGDKLVVRSVGVTP